MESRKERRERIIAEVRAKLKNPDKPAIPSIIKCTDQNYIGLDIDGINAAICFQVADTCWDLGFDSIRLEESDFTSRDEQHAIDISALEERISIKLSPDRKVVKVRLNDGNVLTIPFKTRIGLYKKDGSFYMNLERQPICFDSIEFRVMLLVAGRTIKELYLRTNE